MYEVIFEKANGSSNSVTTDNYASARNTFYFYAEQKSLFGLAHVYFVNNEYVEDSMVA